MSYLAAKYLKPYQGLKPDRALKNCIHACRKIPKTLSGIETQGAPETGGGTWAAKYLKPYQGLKPTSSDSRYSCNSAAKYLKPYQGLKRPTRWIVGQRPNLWPQNT